MRVSTMLAAAVLAALGASLGAGLGGGSAGAQSGPDQLTEVYRDWVVRCRPQGDVRFCQMTQELSQASSGQRVVMADLRPGGDAGALSGSLVVPFGVLVAEPVLLIVDGRPLKELSIRTCVPGGCVAPIALSAGEVSALDGSATLTVALQGASDSGPNPVSFDMSLAGFGEAHGRLAQLAGR